MEGAVHEAKEQVLWGCRAMCERGYVLGTAGNISARVSGEDLLVMTPTSLPYEDLTPDDLVVLTLQGDIIQGTRKPSIECSMHRALLAARPEVCSIIHTHSKYATAAGVLEGCSAVPLMDIETAMYIGGDIPVAPFAPPGSEALAQNVARHLGDRAGVIMEGHGAVGLGLTMRAAMNACDILERNCEIYLLVLAAGKRKPLPEGPMHDLCAASGTVRGIRME